MYYLHGSQPIVAQMLPWCSSKVLWEQIRISLMENLHFLAHFYINKCFFFKFILHISFHRNCHLDMWTYIFIQICYVWNMVTCKSIEYIISSSIRNKISIPLGQFQSCEVMSFQCNCKVFCNLNSTLKYWIKTRPSIWTRGHSNFPE